MAIFRIKLIVNFLSRLSTWMPHNQRNESDHRNGVRTPSEMTVKGVQRNGQGQGQYHHCVTCKIAKVRDKLMSLFMATRLCNRVRKVGPSFDSKSLDKSSYLSADLLRLMIEMKIGKLPRRMRIMSRIKLGNCRFNTSWNQRKIWSRKWMYHIQVAHAPG
jgi:hypothetical protein